MKVHVCGVSHEPRSWVGIEGQNLGKSQLNFWISLEIEREHCISISFTKIKARFFVSYLHIGNKIPSPESNWIEYHIYQKPEQCANNLQSDTKMAIWHLEIWQNSFSGQFRHAKIEVFQMAQVLAKPDTLEIIVSIWVGNWYKRSNIWKIPTELGNGQRSNGRKLLISFFTKIKCPV